MEKLKYLAVFLLPISVWISFQNEGWITFIPLIIFFLLVPLLELFLPKDEYNLDDIEIEKALKDPFYSLILYLLVPIQYFFLGYFLLHVIDEKEISSIIGHTVSMGIMCGVIGINLGHELGHRMNKSEVFLGDLLLLSSLQNHFIPYHNRGHHFQVATPNDPATARKNEWLYVFWFRSQIGSYIQAWQIELKRMRIMQLPALHWKNKMVQYTFFHLSVLISLYFFVGWKVLLFFVIVSALGILLLETVNYIEHYGLLRKVNENGNYERVKRIHSWNSNHRLGRVVLFELSRHSDHHYKADKPYQILETHEESPEMPTGYPGMMLLALIPPLFFKVMNKKIAQLS